MAAKPLYATPRTPGSKTRAGPLIRLAKLLLITLMPWQQLVLETALEEDEHGNLRYRQVVITVPRQNGKTTLLLLLSLGALMFGTRDGIAYCAQSISDALAKWRYELWPQIVAARLDRKMRLRFLKNASGAAIFSSATECFMRILSNSPTSGHGMTVKLAIFDEAFEAADASREQALLPAMITILNAQYWVMSTAGGIDAVYFREKVELGRKLVKEDRCVEAQLCYLEWGLADSMNWQDETLWPDAIPALGITITLERLRSLKESMNPDEFRRAFLNQWTLVAAVWAVPRASWLAARTDAVFPSGRFWVAADAPGRRSGPATITFCADGVLRVAKAQRGTAWIAGTLREMYDKYPLDLEGVGISRNGLLRKVGEVLEGDGVRICWFDWIEMGSACERLHEAIVEGAIGIHQSRVLDAAIQDAEARDRISGTWVWRSKKGGEPVSPLLSATMAYELDRAAIELDEHGSGFADVDSYNADELAKIAEELGI